MLNLNPSTDTTLRSYNCKPYFSNKHSKANTGIIFD